MKVHYRIDVDSASYDEVANEAENVVYKVNYTLWVWTGSKNLNDELERGENGEIYSLPPNVLCTKFGVDFELSEYLPETFIPLDDISEKTLVQWMLDKWNHETIEDLRALKALINTLKSTSTKYKSDFSSIQSTLTV